jgi:hypothetical protein
VRVIPGEIDDAGAITGDAITFAGAGDVADCSLGDVRATASLLDHLSGAVFTLGDNAYQNGTLSDFLDCYDPTWGRHRSRTHPVIGNHEYHVPHAGAYFAYFGSAAGKPLEGYYSFDLGSWHVVTLNSNCGTGALPSDIDIDKVTADFGGCAAGSPQERWLRADLAAHASSCTLALWHHPLFSSGPEGDYRVMRAFWQALDDYGADLVLVGHDHDYERFAPQHADGTRDDAAGIREIVVGTGGTSLTAFDDIVPNSLVRQSTTHGVLELTLHPESYEWKFLPVRGEPAFADGGHAECH